METKHKNIQVKPCEINWYAMDPRGAGNRFCQNCQKVVHDMSGMSEAEAEAFLEANPGSCGNFLDGQVEILHEEKITPLNNAKLSRSQGWKKAAAAVAALTFLNGEMPAVLHHPDLAGAETGQPHGEPENANPSTNTLLTGVVLDQYDRPIGMLLEMEIYLGSKLIASSVEVDHGLFSLNLAEKALPSDTITLLIPKQNSNWPLMQELKVQTVLGQGQNLVINADIDYPKRTAGVMIRR